jgi:hypothetical protein
MTNRAMYRVSLLLLVGYLASDSGTAESPVIVSIRLLQH